MIIRKINNKGYASRGLAPSEWREGKGIPLPVMCHNILLFFSNADVNSNPFWMKFPATPNL
jgi:hypothetical protein